MKQRVLTALTAGIASVAVMSLMGCTPEARQDVKDAGGNLNSAAEKSAQGTAEAVNKAGEKVAEKTDAAVQTTKEAVKETGTAVKEGAQQVGEAVGGAAENAVEATKGAAKTVEKGVEKAGTVVTLTPKIKNALVVSKQIDASTINIDTDATKKVVMIKGTIPTQAKKDLATQITKKELADAGADYAGYKVQNDLTVTTK